MTGRFYVAQSLQNVGPAEDFDFFEFTASSTTINVLHSVHITQSSDAGDSESEQFTVAIHRATASGSAGTTGTSPLQLGYGAYSGTAEINNTSKATSGAILHIESVNIMAGFAYIPTPETRIVVPSSGRLAVSMVGTPADSLTFNSVAVIEEIG